MMWYLIMTGTILPFMFNFTYTTSLYDKPLLTKWIQLDYAGL